MHAEVDTGTYRANMVDGELLRRKEEVKKEEEKVEEEEAGRKEG